MAHSPQHQNSRQSASQTFPWPTWNLSLLANQPYFSSQLQVQRLRQDLANAQKQIQKYEDLKNKICVNCRAHFEKCAPVGLATSSTTGAVIVSPSSKPKNFLPDSSNFPRSSAPPNRAAFWLRVFRGHYTTGLDSIQPSSLSATQHPPGTSTSLRDIPNPLDWPVDFNGNVNPALSVKLGRVLTHGGTVGRVRFSPDGKYLAVGVKNGKTYIYDMKTGAKSCFLVNNSETEKPGIWSLCFSPDGKYLAAGASDGQLRIWDIATRRTRNIFRGHTTVITDLDFSPDGHFLVSCSYDETVRIWRMRDGFSKLLEDKYALYSVKFNLDGRHIAAGNDDGILKIWNVRTSQLAEEWIAHREVVSSVAFTLDGKGLVSSGRDDTWKYWDINLLELPEPGYGMTRDSTARQRSQVTAVTNDVWSIAISPDSQWVASGSDDNIVRIWDLRNAALQCTLHGHEGIVGSVDFCPTGKYLASGSHGGDGRVVLWRYKAA